MRPHHVGAFALLFLAGYTPEAPVDPTPSGWRDERLGDPMGVPSSGLLTPPAGRDPVTHNVSRRTGVMPARQEHTGFISDAWQWDGKRSIDRPRTAPSARVGHAMAYDAARQRVVLFGGLTAGDSVLGDTWEWDGTRWTEKRSTTSPPVRSAHAMAYDGARERVVLFGGFTSDEKLLSDTWEYDGTLWIQRRPSTAPAARALHAMAYDAARRRIVVFAGLTDGDRVLGDTWEWDGTTWLEKQAATHPPARSVSAMAYDATRQRIVLVGGLTPDDSVLGDEWDWDGTTWSQREGTGGPGAPGPRLGHAMGYDEPTRRIVLFGGVKGWTLLDDTWVLDGPGEWHLVPLTLGRPSARRLHTVAIAATTGRLVLFGGQDEDGVLDDLWEWDGQRWVERSTATPRVETDPTAFRLERYRFVTTLLQAHLRNLATAQESYLAISGRYASRLSELDFIPGDGVSLEMTWLGQSGWAAVATHREGPGVRCGVFIGRAPAPLPEAKTEGEPGCTTLSGGR